MLRLLLLKAFGFSLSVAVETSSLTEFVCHVIKIQNKVPSRISVVRLQPDEVESAGRIQYFIDESAVEKSEVRIDPDNEELQFSAMPSPMSMAVTVRATAKTRFNQHVTAATVVRVHMVCFVGSHAWDTI
ncbi:unnamed protein product [Fasciola hepatica]|uniref:Uncharacterized protein n=1 Tax=Fasciola hepatica TaxID=6192 RepID=A0ABC9HH37_FASHE|nr:unnamed protein product [Fasciola hepatica]